MARTSLADLSKMLRDNPDLRVEGDLQEAPSAPRLSEHDLQVAVIAECDRRALADPRYGLIMAIPNGGHRHPAVAAKLKAEGVRAGVPDLFLAYPSRGHNGLWLELKVGRNQLSDEQRKWGAKLKEVGYCCFVVRNSVQEVMDHIEWYLEE